MIAAIRKDVDNSTEIVVNVELLEGFYKLEQPIRLGKGVYVLCIMDHVGDPLCKESKRFQLDNAMDVQILER